jgi:hypothetical protein
MLAPSEDVLKRNTQKIAATLRGNTILQDYIGADWQVVWGPVTTNSRRRAPTAAVDSFVTDNTMYVARGTSLETGKPMYVVGIAGTNILSKKSWLLEDFNVALESDWGMPNSGRISEGSMVGLSVLINMRDESSGQTLLEFFGTRSDLNTTEVAFTGHSLGGALSPLVALRFIEWKEALGAKTPVRIYPVAGATPGDALFANYAAQKFGDDYRSVINAYDIVPHSWRADMFAKIPTLYASAPPFNPGGQQGFTLPATFIPIFNAVKAVIEQKNYQRIATDQEIVFTGKPNTYPDQSGTFFKEAAHQHMDAYFSDGFQFPQPIINVLKDFLN